MGLSHVLPRTWSVGDGSVFIGGVSLASIADEFSTPTYVMDVEHIRERMRTFDELFSPAVRAFAAKSFFVAGMAELVAEKGWWLDVVSLGEARLALLSGVSADRLILHGNAKPYDELVFAVESGIGRIAIDHVGEIEDLIEIATVRSKQVSVLLRLNVEVSPDTHPKIRTSGSDVHFGMLEREAELAIDMIEDSDGVVSLEGVHCHLGSQLSDPADYVRASQAATDVIVRRRRAFPETVDIDLGGGFPVAYVAADIPVPLEAFADTMNEAHRRAVDRVGSVRLMIEPGRSIVANAGVTLFRVAALKAGPAEVPFLAVDGGISDNPRPALYGAEYEAFLPHRIDDPHDHPFRVVGRHCETGDVVVPEAQLPHDVHRGELLVVPATGAYGYTMSSRYNLVPRPPVVFVEDGEARLVVSRDGSLPGVES